MISGHDFLTSNLEMVSGCYVLNLLGTIPIGYNLRTFRILNPPQNWLIGKDFCELIIYYSFDSAVSSY